jgi:transposase-like protein
MKPRKIETLINVINGFQSEKEAIAFFIKQRWNGKPVCPHKDCYRCGKENNKIYVLKDGKHFKCTSCNRLFSYKTGTIFEDSKITLKKWFTAIYLHTANKKGISSIQLGKHIGVTQKTAWFMLHRIRFVLGNKDNNPFNGITEVDEVYLGGKEENKHKNKKGLTKKTIAIGIVNRETGEARIETVENTTYPALAEKVMENVSIGSNLITDELSSYKTLKIYYNHNSINHSKGQYVKKSPKVAFKIHTNTVEGLFSHVKRTVTGTYHWFSERHANKYLKEISFRYSTRKQTDEARFYGMFALVNCRLTYKKLISV